MKRIILTLFVFALWIGCSQIGLSQGQPGTVRCPDNVDTQDSLLRAADAASSMLSGAVSNSATSITLLDAGRFPSSGLAVIESEKIVWTGKSANTLTGVVRGARGTFATAHASGVAVRMAITSDYHNVLVDSIICTQGQVNSKQPLDADLTAIAALAAANDDIIQRKAGAWVNRTIAQLKIDLALTKSDVGLGSVTNDAQLKIASNLSDLNNAATARTNLGLGSLAVVTPTGTPNGSKFLRDDFSWQAVSVSPSGINGDIQKNSGGSFAPSLLNESGGNITQSTGQFIAPSHKASGTVGAGYFEGVNQASAPGTPSSAGRLFWDSSNRLSWKGTNGFVRTFDGTANTADRVYVLPDAAGTVVLDTAVQTLTGKTLTSPSLVTPSLGVASATSLNTALLNPSGNVVEQRNGGNAQRLNVYNSFVDGSNFEQGFLIWNGSRFGVGTSQLGSGSARPLVFWVGGAERWEITTGTDYRPITDNASKMGDSTHRPSETWGVKFCMASGVCWTTTAGAPAGSCTNGALNTDTTNGKLYVCEAAAWVAK